MGVLWAPVLGRHLGLGDFSEWGEDERVEWLVKELQSKRPLVPPAMPLTDEVKEVCFPGFASLLGQPCRHGHGTGKARRSGCSCLACLCLHPL